MFPPWRVSRVGIEMDRVVHFAATTALTLAGTIILGLGGAAYLAQCSARQVLVFFKPQHGGPLASCHLAVGRLFRTKTPARRASEWRNLLQPEGGQSRHWAMAQPLQRRQAALIAGISATRTTGIQPSPATSGSPRSDAIVSLCRWYKISVRSLLENLLRTAPAIA